jgi:prefoldin subunit 5
MDAKVAEIQKKNVDNLKTMDATYQKKLDRVNKTIEDLRAKIGK